MPEIRKAWLQIHFCVFLWGFTAILGRLISLPALSLVFWRMLLVALLLFCVPKVWRGLSKLSLQHILAFAGVGVLVSLHWVTFYLSVKLANASVTATCMAFSPVFLCVLEPLITGRHFELKELLIGFLVLPGIALLVGGTPEQMNLGVFIGVVSAFLTALYAAFNKRLILHTDSLTATGIELLSGGVFVLMVAIALVYLRGAEAPPSALIPAANELFALPSREDLIYLATLAFVCTLLPFALSLGALRHLSAYASSLAVNMEPIYAIMLAVLILDEQKELGVQFYAGASIILLVVFLYPLLSRKESANR